MCYTKSKSCHDWKDQKLIHVLYSEDEQEVVYERA